jgi:hypothetical protein
LSEGRRCGRQMHGERARLRRFIAVVEGVQVLFGADRGEGRERPLDQLATANGVGGRVDVNREGGETIRPRVRERVDAIVLVRLAAGGLGLGRRNGRLRRLGRRHRLGHGGGGGRGRRGSGHSALLRGERSGLLGRRRRGGGDLHRLGRGHGLLGFARLLGHHGGGLVVLGLGLGARGRHVLCGAARGFGLGGHGPTTDSEGSEDEGSTDESGVLAEHGVSPSRLVGERRPSSGLTGERAIR